MVTHVSRITIMELSYELLMEFLEQAKAHAQTRDKDRRRAPRIDMSVDAHILPVGASMGAGLVATTAINLSARGMCLVAAERIAQNTEICLHLAAKGGSYLWIRGTVVRVTQAPPYRHGVRFADVVRTAAGDVPMMLDPRHPALGEDPATLELLQRLRRVDEVVQTAATSGSEGAAPPAAHTATRDGSRILLEARHARRAPVRVESTATLLRKDEDRPLRVNIRDISTGGVGFACATRLSIGDLVVLLIPFRGRGTKEVLSQVVRCVRLNPVGYHFGCAFLDSRVLDPSHPPYPDTWRSANIRKPAAPASPEMVTAPA